MKKYFPSLLIAAVGFGFITFGLMTNEPPVKKQKQVNANNIHSKRMER